MRAIKEDQGRHRAILEKYPAPEDKECVCDPVAGRWCAFHADFDTDMSDRSRDLLKTLADRALTLHDRIQDYLSYPVAANHKAVSGAVGGAETLIELYTKERELDHQAKRERIREGRGGVKVVEGGIYYDIPKKP